MKARVTRPQSTGELTGSAGSAEILAERCSRIGRQRRLRPLTTTGSIEPIRHQFH